MHTVVYVKMQQMIICIKKIVMYLEQSRSKILVFGKPSPLTNQRAGLDRCVTISLRVEFYRVPAVFDTLKKK